MPDLKKVQTKYCCNLLLYPERKISLLFMERHSLAQQPKPVVFVFTGVSNPEITVKDKFLGCVGQATKLQVLKAWSMQTKACKFCRVSACTSVLGNGAKLSNSNSSICKPLSF